MAYSPEKKGRHSFASSGLPKERCRKLAKKFDVDAMFFVGPEDWEHRV